MPEPMIDGVGLNLTSIAHGDTEGAARLMKRWAEIGCTHVEISARRLDIVLGGRLNMPRVRAVAAGIEAAGLKPVLHAPHAINLMDLARSDLHKAVAEASIEFCRITGCHSMVVHSGRVGADEWVARKEVLIEAERDALRRLGDLAGEAGVRLAVENLIASPANAGKVITGADPRALAAQLAAVNHDWVGACLDFGHAWLSSRLLGFDFIEALETFAPHVWHLHLHDNCGHPQGATGFDDSGDAMAYGIGDMHAPMFWGTIPWAELLPRMRFRPRTFGGIELNGMFNDQAAEVVATAHGFADFLNGNGDLKNPYEAAA